MKNKPSVKQILLDLIAIMPQIVNEFKNDEKYRTLIDYISSEDFYNKDDLRYPTLKEIAEKTKLKTYQVRKQLEEIYSKLMGYEYDFTFDFSKVDIIINVEYYKRFATIKCQNLKHLPKIGESIRLPFLKAQIGIDFFYVEDIRHQFASNKQTIDLMLKGGIYNSYWYYRKHKALELGEIGIFEQYDLNDTQLKVRLGLRR